MHDTALSQLKDIMPDSEIHTGLLLPAIVLLLVLMLSLSLYLYRRNRNKPQPTPQTVALQHLQALDWRGEIGREQLYQFTLHTRTYLDGREDPAFESIQQSLQPHKYHPDAPLADKTVIETIARYIKGLS